jgi:hypothetical protein
MFRLDSPIMARERQEALYAYLLQRGDAWISMKAVAFCTKLYPEFKVSEDFHDTTARRWMTKDIQAINESPDFEKIILSSSNGIKLADKAEFEYFIASEYAEIFRKLKRVRMLAKKGGLDRQCTIEGEIREAFMMEGS